MCFSEISGLALIVSASAGIMSEAERERSINGAQRGVVTKIIKEVDEVLAREEPMDAGQLSRLNVKSQQLESKLRVLNDNIIDILSKCDVGDIGWGITESEAITAKIMDCQLRIREAIK